MRVRAVLVEHQHFAVFHVAHVLRADDVERAGLGRQDGTAVELAEHQRPDAERIARANQFLVGQADEGVGAFQHSQAFDETVDEAIAVRARHQVKDHLGVGGRLHHGAFAHELAPQRDAVGQVAVMADRKAAGIEFGEQRLDVAQNRFAGGRIADVADSGGAGQAVDHFTPGKGVADQAEPALGMEPLAVVGDDTGSLLAAVLERMQAKRRNRSGVRMAEYAENAALFAQPVRIGVEGFGFGHLIGSPVLNALISWPRNYRTIPIRTTRS